jgi:hypothetical protein
MGGLAAIGAATKDVDVKALVLDSVPQNAEVMVASTVEKRFPFGSVVTSKFAAVRHAAVFLRRLLQTRNVM